MKTAKTIFVVTVAVALSLITFIGCENDSNPIATGATPNSQITAISLLKDGNEVAQATTSTSTGKIYIETGLNAEVYEVVFLDMNGAPLTLNPDLYKMCCNFEDYSCANMEKSNKLEPYQFQLCGNNAGETGLNIVVNKGSNETFRSATLSIKVL